MKFDKKLISQLADAYCPNDIGVKDVDVGGSHCHKNRCEECWIESLNRLEKCNIGEESENG